MSKQKMAHKGANKGKKAHKGGKQACYQAKKARKGVLEGQMWVWIGVHSSIILEYG